MSMEKSASAIAFILLFGCLGQGAQNVTTEPGPLAPQPQENATPLSNTTTPPVLSGNITEQAPAGQPGVPPGNGTEEPPQADASNDTDVEPLPQAPAGLRFGKYLLVLDDVSIIPTSDEPCGIFSILDASDYSVLDKEIICPGESKMYAGYRIFVVKVAAGYAGAGNWADVRIYG